MSQPLIHETALKAGPHRLTIGQLNTAILCWTNELAPHGVFTTDSELRVTSWNQWLEKQTQNLASQVLGRPLVEVIPSLVERRLDHYYRDALNGEAKVLSRSLHGYLLPAASPVPSAAFRQMQQSARIAPLILEGQICGTITIVEDVTEREWQHLTLRQARQRSELLASTLAHLIESRDPDQMVAELFMRIAGALRLDNCIHHVIEPHSQRMKLHSAVGLCSGDESQCAMLDLGQGMCGTIAQTRERLIVNHLQQHPATPGTAPCKELGFRAFAGFPLLSGSRLLGSVGFLTRARDSFADEEIQFLFTISQYLAVALDRTQHENNLRASEERFRNMAETVPDVIFTALPDGQRDYLSPRFYAFTGLPPGSGVGFGWMQALHPEDVGPVHLAWEESAQTGESYQIEYRLRDRQGRYRWFRATARPIRDQAQQIVRWFGVSTDIDDLKRSHAELFQAQQELAKHAATLEETVQQRTAELRETISHLESFSYTVAHDLRAPIRAMEGYSRILLEDYGERLADEAKALISNMGRAARRLDALTKDVLNYTKVTTQHVDLMPLDPGEVLQDVLVMNPALQTPNASIAIVRPLERVMAHPTLLSQCFSNLLSNAVKFVAAGATPHVVVRSERVSPNGAPDAGRADAASAEPLPESPTVEPAASEPSPPLVRLWVEDNGIGMDPEVVGRVFGIFERGRGVGNIPGTGIGLAIVAKAVQRMGGAYGVESAPGKGSRFWIRLRAAQP